MADASQITEFGKVLIYLTAGMLLVGFTFFLASFVALKKPNPEKSTSYECGEEPSGNSWIQLNTRFYVVALIFLLFDVEMVFIFPWASIYSNKLLIAADNRWGWLTLVEMFIFIGILLIGLVYVWKKGDLNWLRPQVVLPSSPAKIPQGLYDRINQEVYTVRKFSELPVTEALTAEPHAASINIPKKPLFKPSFKKLTE